MRYPALIFYLVLSLATAATLFPLVWMVSVSLMPPAEAMRYPPPLWPEAPTLEHYRTLFDRLAIARYALNSLVLAGAVTALSVLVNAAAGYAFARLPFVGRDALFRLLMTFMVIPGQVAMLPLFLLLKQLGLINTYAGVIVPGLASIFGIFLVRQYALSLPQSLFDAARLEGAGELRIFWSLVLPLCRPILITLAVFTFLGSWNDFLWPLIVLTDRRFQTLPVALAALMGEHAVDTELMMSGAALTVVPVIVLFLAAQRYYLGGLMQGGVKG
ncbi:carbohydrate ABC transporter permease [Methylococcus capsulatus]|jgi:multiple sugar transport system permease protein|uniref:carbohydrate ABC transporter permease n=1 Tax=Methylococcus capsulatus TaxID=414 RepID=UPI001C52D51D|nr:carbohydrate ABC transporter permease [Methylococcus capsulatus]QXP87444.1 carbohydrate ABC transporter permease [Methylococcus capsulatus]QXP92818.1 carbohydrate ABC transporter permease [Methylococcus capsulatus]UQN12452.1 carbohydrate ABC transporter permease [Methylococcus capsulatus]